MDEEADIYINLEREYDGAYMHHINRIGAVGDYNGDDVDDFVTVGGNAAVIYAGNDQWRVDVGSRELPSEYEFTMRAIPNPFNSQVTVSYTIPKSSGVQLSVYDIDGRLVKLLDSNYRTQGNYTTSWEFDTAGLYLVERFLNNIAYL